MPESIVKIGNRFADNIKREIALLPNSIENIITSIQNKEGIGFRLHNLAVPCEMLVKYNKEALLNNGFDAHYTLIQSMGNSARQLQELGEMYSHPNSQADEEEINGYIKLLNAFQAKCEKLVPTLFFI